jgi:hypothetical protein
VGIDIEIYFEAEGEPTDLRVLCEGQVEEANKYERRFGPTHKVSSLSRYYGPGYERGPWPEICGTLMTLFASTNVKRVWYFGDSIDIENAEPITSEEVLNISRHYMQHGERPYRQRR